MKPPEIKRLPIIQYHDLMIDPQCHTVALSGEKIILFPKEFNVLLLLAHYPGWVLTPTQIYTSIWHEDPIDCNHIIRNTVCQLRRKLGNADLIQTVTGYGYKLIYR